MTYRVIYAVLCLGILPHIASAKDFLWRVRTNNSVVFLAGSFHYLRQSDVSAPPFPIASFEEAFAQSQQVVFEANPNPDDEAAVSRHLQRKALLPSGVSLRSMLPAATYSRVHNLLVADGASPRLVEHLRPWYVSFNLFRIFAGRRGFESEYGIDQRYYDLAGAQGKPRLYLENPYEHINVVAATPQTEWLADIPGQLADRGASLLSSLEVYKTGDVAELTRRVSLAARREPGITRGLLVNRNLRWLPKIETYLQQSQTTMVVVGAAHVVRGNGLVSLLEKRGYEVTQLPEVPPPVPLVAEVASGAAAD